EVLALLEWRITRTTQALQLLDLSGPRGDVDPLARTILLTTALSGLLAAAVTMRNAPSRDRNPRQRTRYVPSRRSTRPRATCDATTSPRSCSSSPTERRDTSPGPVRAFGDRAANQRALHGNGHRGRSVRQG
ncbi:MAG: hypothetical protein LC777_00550, partial [Actinobacteria bacterium]|nr:hypothetical protein [Actinomycetota bacterium]